MDYKKAEKHGLIGRGSAMKRKQTSGWLVLIAVLCCLMSSSALAGVNLVTNGSFDAPGDFLSSWRYIYDASGDSWYTNNHNFISVVENDGTRKHVLRLHGTYLELQVPGQGVKVDSYPIPVDISKGKFRFSVYARSTGPTCRILIEAYRWAPGVTPHDHPKNTELRKCYKFSQVYFGKQVAATMASLSPAWQKGTTVFPEDKLSDMAKKNLAQIQFLVVHIVAIGGSDGDVFVDDVNLEKIN